MKRYCSNIGIILVIFSDSSSATDILLSDNSSASSAMNRAEIKTESEIDLMELDTLNDHI